MFLSAFVWKINPFSGEIAVFQVKLAAILKMADPPIVTDTFCPNNPDYLFIDIKWPPKPLVFYTKVKKVSHFGNPIIMSLNLVSFIKFGDACVVCLFIFTCKT